MFHDARPHPHVHPRIHPHVHLLRPRSHRTIRRLFAGTALILFGIACLLKNQGLVSGNDLWLVVPALVALSGLARLVAAPRAVNVVRAVLRLAVAAYLFVVIEHLGGWTFAATWPVLLIGVGGSMLGYEWLVRRPAQEHDW